MEIFCMLLCNLWSDTRFICWIMSKIWILIGWQLSMIHISGRLYFPWKTFMVANLLPKLIETGFPYSSGVCALNLLHFASFLPTLYLYQFRYTFTVFWYYNFAMGSMLFCLKYFGIVHLICYITFVVDRYWVN